MSKSKRPFKKHFRVNRSKEASAHPTYVIRKKGDNYDYIGLAHSPVTDNKKNIKLSKNPNPKDNRVSYIRPFFRSGTIKKFSSKRIRGWKFAKRDKKKVRKVSRIKKQKKRNVAPAIMSVLHLLFRYQHLSK